MAKARVLLFKPSGKYYTTDEWEIPTPEELKEKQKHLTRLQSVGDYYPSCMKFSKDFRRIDNGPVLVESQEPWGFPHLFPGVAKRDY
jgi:hypothetical protein